MDDIPIIYITSINGDYVHISVAGVEHKIPLAVNSIQQLISHLNLNTQRIQIAEKIYNINELQNANFLDLARSSQVPLQDICRKQVRSVLEQGLGRKYIKELYAQRQIENEVNDFLDLNLKDKCFVIIAPAGSGKTNLLCKIAEDRAKQHPTVLLIGSIINLESYADIGEAILHELSAYGQLNISNRNGLSLLGEVVEDTDTPGLILIDGINEYHTPKDMRKSLKRLVNQLHDKNLKVILTCRDYYWSMYKGDFWGNTIFYNVDEKVDLQSTFFKFSTGEYEESLPSYFRYFKIKGSLENKAYEQCRHPLLLRFFCETYSGQNIGKIKEIRLKELFDQYINRKCYSIAEKLIEEGKGMLLDIQKNTIEYCLLNVAMDLFTNQKTSLKFSEFQRISNDYSPYGDLRSIYSKIRDEFIILEENRVNDLSDPVKITFVYEEFKEYCTALALIKKWRNNDFSTDQLLEKLDDFSSHFEDKVQLIGLIIYLNEFVWQYWNISLWQLLINRSNNWENLIIKTIRKLPEEYLDEALAGAIFQMLSGAEGKSLLKILDLFKTPKVARNMNKEVIRKLEPWAKGENTGLNIRRRAIFALGFMNPDIAERILLECTNVNLGNTIKWRFAFYRNVMNALIRMSTSNSLKKAAEIIVSGNSGLGAGMLIRYLQEYLSKTSLENLIALLTIEQAETRRGLLIILTKLPKELALDSEKLLKLLYKLLDENKDQSTDQYRIRADQYPSSLGGYNLKELVLYNINRIKKARSDYGSDIYESIIGKIVFSTSYIKGNSNSFYKVVSQTAKTALLISLRRQIISGDWMDGKEIPKDVDLNEINSENLQRAQKTFKPEEPFKMGRKYLSLWDGNPRSFFSD